MRVSFNILFFLTQIILTTVALYFDKFCTCSVKKIFSTFLSFFVLINAIGQVSTSVRAGGAYRAIQWGLDQGLLTERWHNAIIKDKNGFLWLGSNHGELCRFDGNNFIQIFSDKDKRGSIRSTNCHAMVEDSLNNIWIGTLYGLSKYDIKTDSFINISYRLDSGGRSIFVFPIWATQDEVYCLEGQNKITSYNITTHERKELAILLDKELPQSGPSPGLTYAVYEKNSHSIWMLLNNEEGLIQISLASGKKTIHRRTAVIKPSDAYNHMDAEAMCYDRKRNCIWINSHDGLSKFSFDEYHFESVNAFRGLVNSKDYFRWVGIDIDPRGKIWLATNPKGILIFDPETESIAQPIQDSVLSNKVSEGNLKIYCDRDGMVWTSHWMSKGIYQLIPTSPTVTRYYASPLKQDSLSSSGIGTLIPGNDGKLWIGTTNGGLNIFDPVSEKFKVLKEKDLPGLKGLSIVPAFIDTIKKKAWLNAFRPDLLYEMDIVTRKCRVIEFRDTANKIIQPIYIFPFLSQPYKDGFLFYDAGHGIFYLHSDSLIAHELIRLTGMVVRLVAVEDSLLFLKVPGWGNGFMTYMAKAGRWIRTPHVADSIGWENLYYDKIDQSYWASARRSILHLDKEFKIIRIYPIDGVNPGFVFFSFVRDDDGNIWFNDNRRNISVLNITTGSVYKLSELDGYQKQTFDITTAFGVKLRGNIYFAGNYLSDLRSGLDRVHPKKIDYPGSLVYVQTMSINQKPIGILPAVGNTNKIVLKYFQNKIAIKTGIIDFYSMGKSNLRYKLESEDSVWHYASYYHTISYERLPPGKYKLLMQASNVAGEFNGPVKSLEFTILPAFWNTWWFRLIAIAAAVALIYVLIRWRLHQKFRSRLERSEREKELADIKQKASELEMQALRSQMNPHFIFNSLNSINRFILQNNKAHASEYLTKFSKLVRLILQNSQAPLISVESELESLALYLDLEALRFDYRFGYKISVPKDLEIDVLMVPPLIIQPYAENAIWHGLMHKEEKGQLDIEVSQENNYLYFRIADDGIGRKQSAALASKSATRHKSMGLKITSDRIAILQNSNGSESPVKINDLVNADGSAAGTEVIIKMPAIYD